MRRRRFPVLMAFLTTILAATAASAGWAEVTEEETVEQTVALGAGGRVEVSTTNGSIKVATGAGGDVRVVAKKKVRADDAARARELLSEVEIRVEESGGVVRVDADVPRSRWHGDESAAVSFELTIPDDAELSATSKNGSIEVREIGGRARLETNNGSIEVHGVGGPLDAESNNGSIKAWDVEGAVRARTNNGSIKADVASAGLDEDVRLTTNNGSVELRLEPTVTASVDARTRHGSVSSEFPGGYQDERRRTLQLDLNGGGPRVEIETNNGSIRLRER